MKKEGRRWLGGGGGRVFRHIKAKLGDFLKNSVQKRVGVRPPPSGSAPEFAAFFCVILSMRCLFNSH